jgi:cytoskeletal protein CcmA (bactofilin family)
MSGHRRCRYTFPEEGTVEESPLEIDARFLNTAGQWRCPRRTTGSDEVYCVFHQDPAERDLTTDQLTRVFLETVNEQSAESDGIEAGGWDQGQEPQANGSRTQRPSWTTWDVLPPEDEPKRRSWRRQARKQFIGATISDIDLSYETLGDGTGYPIDLRAATIGNLELSNATVRNPLKLDGDGTSEEHSARIGEITLDGAEVRGDVSLENRSVTGEISIENATVDGEASLELAAVSGDVSFKDTVIEGDVELKKAAFGSEVVLDRASIDGWASLFRSSVADRVSFESVSVSERVTLKRANVAGRVSLYDATVQEGIWLLKANIRGLSPFSLSALTLKKATSKGEVWLKEAAIGGDVSIDGADIEERITFEKAVVEGHVSLNEVTIERKPLYREGEPGLMRGRLTFSEAILGSLEVQNSFANGKIILDDATVEGDVQLDGTTTERQMSADTVTVEGDCSFANIETEEGVSLDSATVDGNVAVTGATVRHSLSLDETTVGGDLSGDQATIDTVRLTPTAIHGRMRFEEAVIREKLAIDPESFVHPAVTGVSLAEASVAGGALAADNRIARTEDSTVRAEPFLYDLRKASLGDVSVAPDIRRDEWPETASLACAHIVEAQFEAGGEEFPFRRGRVRSLLREADWQLHTLVEGGYWRLAALTRLDDARLGTDALLRALVVDSELRDAVLESAWDEVWDRISNIDAVEMPGWVTPEALSRTTNSPAAIAREDPVTLVGRRLRRVVAPGTSTQGTLQRENGSDALPLGSLDAIQKALRLTAEAIAELPNRMRRAVLSGPDSELRLQRRRAMVEERLRIAEADAAELEEEISTLLAEAAATGRPDDETRQETPVNGDGMVPADLTADLAAMGIGSIGWTSGELSPVDELIQTLATRRSGSLDDDTIQGIRAAATPIKRLAEELVDGLPDVDDHPDRSASLDAILQEEYTAGTATRRFRRELTTELAFALADPTALHPAPTELESTYLIAKNAATDQGDQFSAGEFFIQERLWARERHWRDLRTDERDPPSPRLNGGRGTGTTEYNPDAGRQTEVDATTNAEATSRTVGNQPGVATPTPVRALYRWSSNTLYGLLTGYGERPQRVLAWSVFVVFAFGLLFAGFGTIEAVGVGASGFATTPPYGSALGYFIVSLEAFVTLVLGGSAQIESPLLRLLAQIEGFLGVFSISLFVFTLSRAVHR